MGSLEDKVAKNKIEPLKYTRGHQVAESKSCLNTL